MATAIRASEATSDLEGRLVRPEWIGNISMSVYRVHGVTLDHGRLGLNLANVGHAWGDVLADGAPAEWCWFDTSAIIHVMEQNF